MKICYNRTFHIVKLFIFMSKECSFLTKWTHRIKKPDGSLALENVKYSVDQVYTHLQLIKRNHNTSYFRKNYFYRIISFKWDLITLNIFSKFEMKNVLLRTCIIFEIQKLCLTFEYKNVLQKCNVLMIIINFCYDYWKRVCCFNIHSCSF